MNCPYKLWLAASGARRIRGCLPRAPHLWDPDAVVLLVSSAVTHHCHHRPAQNRYWFWRRNLAQLLYLEFRRFVHDLEVWYLNLKFSPLRDLFRTLLTRPKMLGTGIWSQNNPGKGSRGYFDRGRAVKVKHSFVRELTSTLYFEYVCQIWRPCRPPHCCQIWNSGHAYSNYTILLNFVTNEYFTFLSMSAINL